MGMIKTKEEVQKIKKACRITDALFSNILKNFCFTTEIELRDHILSEIKKKGLKPSFPPIVTSGARAGNEIHPQATEGRLKGFVIIDFGVVCEKYMSDMTRTIYVGTPTEKETEIYNLLLNSQEISMNMVAPGIRCADADRKARDVLGKYSKYFIHTLGHGVGTKIHESPKLYEKLTKSRFKEGMIVTIEPGIYIKGKYGIRIEDTCLVTKHGVQSLTCSPKELISILQ